MFLKQPKFLPCLTGIQKSNQQQQQQQQITTNIRIAKTGKQNMTHGCALSLWAFLGIAFLKDDILLLFVLFKKKKSKLNKSTAILALKNTIIGLENHILISATRQAENLSKKAIKTRTLGSRTVNIQKNRDFHMKRWKLWIKKNKGYLKLSELKSSLLWINPSWYQNPLSGNG